MDEKDKKIARLEELLQSIKDNIDETESVLDSLSNSELQAENEMIYRTTNLIVYSTSLFKVNYQKRRRKMKKKAIIPRLIPAIISSLKILFSPYATQKNKYPEIHYAHNSVLMKENIYSFRQNA